MVDTHKTIVNSPRKEVNTMLSKPKGFTLIELLVVIAIIAILAAILFPVFAKAREKAMATQCLSHLKEVAMACHMYLGDNDGFFPMASGEYSTYPSPQPNSGTGLIPYVENNYAIFRCSLDNGPRPAGYHAATYGIGRVGGAALLPCWAWGVCGYLQGGAVTKSKNIDDINAPANMAIVVEYENAEAYPDRCTVEGGLPFNLAGVGEFMASNDGTAAYFKNSLGISAAFNARHGTGGNYGFADGHAKMLDLAKLPCTAYDGYWGYPGSYCIEMDNIYTMSSSGPFEPGGPCDYAKLVPPYFLPEQYF